MFITVCTVGVLAAFGTKFHAKRIVYSILCGLGFEAFVPDTWMFIQLWFLTYILICYVTIPLIQKVDFKKFTEKQFWGGVIVISAVLQGILTVINSPISWGSLVRFYFAYAIFKRYDIDSQKMKKVIKNLSIFGIPCVLAIIVLRYILLPKGILKKLTELMFIYTQSFLGLVLFYVLYEFFGNVRERQKLLKITDMHSYPVYLTHCLFIGYNTSVIDMFENRLIGTAVALLLTFIASTILHFATKPINRRINLLINRQNVKI